VSNPVSRWLWIVIAAGVLLRLAGLGAAELWYDEAFTRLLVNLPLERMIQATAGDTHPPGYYALLWPWVRLFGIGELSLRLPSVIFSLAGMWLFWSILSAPGVRRGEAQIAMALMALSPIQAYFAQEARMYTLLQALVLLAVYAVVQRNYGMLTLANASLLWVHNYGLFYMALILLLALWREGSLTGELIIACALPALSWLPWLFNLLGQMQTISTGYWIEQVTLGQVIYTLNIFVFGAFTRQFSLAAVLVTVGWLSWGVISVRKSPWSAPVLYLAFAPFAVAIAASLLWRPVYLFRGLIGTAPFIYLILAAPLGRLRGWKALYSAAIIVPMLVAGWVGYWADVVEFKSTTTTVVKQVMAAWQPGDIVYSVNDGTWVTWRAYYDGPLYLMPECPGQHDRGALSPPTREALGAQVADLHDLDYRRAWVLWNYGAPATQCNVDKARQFVHGEPWHLVIDNEFVTSGVWLVEDE
jgi:uncharacterized membrane protein